MFARSDIIARSRFRYSSATAVRNALVKACRLAAASRHSALTTPVAGSRHSQAPRPGASRLATSDPS